MLMSWRPDTLTEVARRANANETAFDAGLREFLDQWQSMTREQRVAALAAEPANVGRVQDAYLGAVAEHLALSHRLDTPEWAEAPHRFLREPFFAGGLESLKATLLVESPLAFRRRLIFISADGLSRPRREFIQDNALSVASLDV
jgi:hypothetical protein